VSPHAAQVDDALRVGPRPERPAREAVSLDPEATAWAVALGAAYVALFWCARSIYSRGGVRMTTRTLATIGLALVAFVAIQRATAPDLLYWYWRPLSEHARPYGPFLDRNSLACWLAMAIPMVIGGAMSRHHLRSHAASGLTTIDSTQIWLIGTTCLMMGGLLASLSRGGLVGGAIGVATLLVLSRSRERRRRSTLWAALLAAAMVTVASFYANFGALAARLRETTETGEWGRRVIWRDTWAMFNDFILTGVGAGAYERGMVVYQRASRTFFFNHAHNEYLQLLVEGGVVFASIAGVALIAFIVGCARKLRADRSPAFWLRAGAVGGLVAAAVQSIADVPLRMGANGALFAVLAGIASAELTSRSGRSQKRAPLTT